MSSGKRILVITTDYPPLLGIGSINVSKITKYLFRFDWLPIVLTSSPAHPTPPLPLEIPQELVYYAPYKLPPDKALIFMMKNLLKRGEKAGNKEERINHTLSDEDTKGIPFILRKIRSWIMGQLWEIPDRYRGWIRGTIKLGLFLIEKYKPDVILASSPYHSALIVASRLSRRTEIPWVAHLRDPWTINPYLKACILRKLLERPLERKTLRTASAIIVVSEGWADFYRHISGRPVFVVHNGFDPEDFPSDIKPNPSLFTILFPGKLFKGKRDITPLLGVIKELQGGGFFKSFPLKVNFFALPAELEWLRNLVKSFGIEDIIEVSPPIDHKEILKRECEATFLFLPLSPTEEDANFYPGKLFEYMGARRPIIVLGPKEAAASRLVESLGIGVICESANEVAEFLKRELLAFYKDGRIPMVKTEKVMEFTWGNRVKKIIEIIESQIGST
jgi:glycosyltransferase involved in cell wall biosynthesis